MSKRATTRVIVQTMRVDNLLASIYDTGLITVTKCSDLNILFRIGNGQSLVDDGYFLKLLKCFSTLTSTHTNFVYDRKYELTIDFHEEISGAAFREILDSDYSDCVKFAAVCGMLCMVPSLSSSEAFYFMDRQTKFEDLGVLNFGDLATYFSPDFQVARPNGDHSGMEYHRRKPVFLSKELHDYFQMYSSFMVNSTADETFEQYFKRVGDDWFVPTRCSSKCTQAFGFTGIGNNGSHNIIKTMKRDQMILFYRDYEKFSPALYEFFKERILSGVVPAISDPETIDSELVAMGRSLEGLATILTRHEMKDLSEKLTEDIRDRFIGHYRAGDMAKAVVSYFYIKRGAEGVIELVRYIKATGQTENFWDSYKSYRVGGRRTVTIADFVAAADDCYSGYPLDWTMQMLLK